MDSSTVAMCRLQHMSLIPPLLMACSGLLTYITIRLSGILERKLVWMKWNSLFSAQQECAFILWDNLKKLKLRSSILPLTFTCTSPYRLLCSPHTYSYALVLSLPSSVPPLVNVCHTLYHFVSSFVCFSKRLYG